MKTETNNATSTITLNTPYDNSIFTTTSNTLNWSTGTDNQFLITTAEYYPGYYNWYTTHPNKTEQAFKVAQHLIDNKKVTIPKVKDFIELVNLITQVL